MSNENSINRRNVSDDQFKLLISSAASATGMMWLAFTDVSLAAFGHANKPSNTHSPDRILTAYKTIIDCEISTVRAAFKSACKTCCSIEIIVKDGKIETKFDKEHWEKMENSDTDPFKGLEEKGLKFYKAKIKKGSAVNPITAKNQFQITTNEIANMMNRIFSIEKDNLKIQQLKVKFESLKIELTLELERLSPKKLNESMLPANDSNLVDEVVSF